MASKHQIHAITLKQLYIAHTGLNVDVEILLGLISIFEEIGVMRNNDNWLILTSSAQLLLNPFVLDRRG